VEEGLVARTVWFLSSVFFARRRAIRGFNDSATRSLVLNKSRIISRTPFSQQDAVFEIFLLTSTY
jgi:hypothetical protein